MEAWVCETWDVEGGVVQKKWKQASVSCNVIKNRKGTCLTMFRGLSHHITVVTKCGVVVLDEEEERVLSVQTDR